MLAIHSTCKLPAHCTSVSRKQSVTKCVYVTGLSKWDRILDAFKGSMKLKCKSFCVIKCYIYIYIYIYIYTYYSLVFLSVSLFQKITIIQKVRRFQEICYRCYSAYGTGRNTRTRPSKLLGYAKKKNIARWATQTSAVAGVWSKDWKIYMGCKNPEI